MTRGPAATRTSSTVAFRINALIEVELAVYSATVSEHGVKRNQFTTDGHPVGNAPVDKQTGEIIDRSVIVKKIATDLGPVYVEDHEVEALFKIDPNTMVVKAYQPESLFYSGAYVPKSPMTVEVAKRKVGTKKVVNTVGQQLFAGLLEVMRDEGVMAVCEITTRGVPKPAVLLSDGTMWIVYHDDELREPRPGADIEVPPEAVATIRDQFVKPLLSEDPLDLTDTRSAAIQAYADTKALEGKFDAPDAPTAAPERESAGSTDLMALLNASIGAGV